MVDAVANRLSSKPRRALYKVFDTRVLRGSAYHYEVNMTEDEIDRLTLAAAAERYEGKDWREISEPL